MRGVIYILREDDEDGVDWQFVDKVFEVFFGFVISVFEDFIVDFEQVFVMFDGSFDFDGVKCDGLFYLDSDFFCEFILVVEQVFEEFFYDILMFFEGGFVLGLEGIGGGLGD